VDKAAEKVDGTILVDVHYYEQGNVSDLSWVPVLLLILANTGSARNETFRFISLPFTVKRIPVDRLAHRHDHLED
jgi:hypothetical protein